eukprot:TRINITY_DN3378_c0_g1_i4.p1 TRINITY_DN3378_c0_g1~~TRINITY_DN3378_c0_g1_i4.p1  ORF type:complete len:687 (-),score=221.73 TRINITY_DN3378_c0_g1_i4:58-2118(-)
MLFTVVAHWFLLAAVITKLDMKVVPYIVFLLGPILSCISDQDQVVRETVAHSFAIIVRLMPLESSADAPAGLSEAQLSQRQHDRSFLEQLMDGRKLDNYTLSIKLCGELRRYQQEGVNWLAFLNKYHLHGILCDDMGLGKTLQTLCIIAGNAHTVAHREDAKGLPSLVVCPPTLVGHWHHEIAKFLSKEYLIPLSYVGSPLEREKLRKTLTGRHVMITSYDILRNDVDYLCNLHFNYCVLDEGHLIKNSKTKVTQAVKRVHANNRLILSGTPVQNNVLELWSLFDFLMPGFLGTEKQFNDQYSKPILASKDPNCSQQDQEAGILALDALHRQVLPFLLRRLKEDVLQDLPPKIIQDYYCDLSPLQVKLYDMARKSVEGDKSAAKDSQAGHIFQTLQYLRKVCNHPLLVMDAQSSKALAAEAPDLHDIQHAPKLLALRDLLHECGIGTSSNSTEAAPLAAQHRVLVFAQLKSFLDIVEEDLFKVRMPSVTYMRLDGSVPLHNRHNLVVKFNEDPTIDVLLLTTSVGGLGLNLTGADTVIFLEHDWNPSKDLQAMDRAHRLGQTKVVNVYRLISRGTLEEKIMGLQQFKTHLANTVINRENENLATMDTAHLLDLFALSPTAGTAAPTQKLATATGNDEAAAATSSTTAGLGGGATKALQNLQQLWDESQYEELKLSAFMQQLKPSST